MPCVPTASGHCRCRSSPSSRSRAGKTTTVELLLHQAQPAPVDHLIHFILDVVDQLDLLAQVLRLLAAGWRNQKIARELVVMLETVKQHASRTLGLIPSGWTV
jgi:ATP/maltotriose-dependent transcriptional regulator MalT